MILAPNTAENVGLGDLPDYAEVGKRIVISYPSDEEMEVLSTVTPISSSIEQYLFALLQAPRTSLYSTSHDHDFLREKLRRARQRLHQHSDALRPAISANLRLRGRDTANDERERLNNEAIGGMRNPYFSLAKVPGHDAFGSKVWLAALPG